MLYVKAIDNTIIAYPYTQTDLIRDNPSTSFPARGISPADLADWNVFPVHFANQPVVDTLTHRVIELAPFYDGQSWIQQWDIEAISQEEIEACNARQAIAIRRDRNNRLTDSDWTQLADAPVDHNAWANYRQALRDITIQDGFPLNILWPTKP